MKSIVKFQIIFSIVFLVGLTKVAGDNLPEQVHLAIGRDASTMVVSWVTMAPTMLPIVKYGTSALTHGTLGDTTDFEYNGVHRYIHTVTIDNLDPSTIYSLTHGTLGDTVDFEYNGVHRYIHTVTIDNLDPSTIYYYKVGSGDGMSKKIYQFQSFPKGNNFSLRVCAFGDLGYLNGTSIPYLIQAAERGDFDMIIHIGDIAYDLHTDNGERGDLYMKELEPLFSRVPYMVIAGNHEDDGKNFSHYQNRFKMPGLDNQFYSFDLGAVHFVGVSTEYYGFFYEYGQQPVFNQYNWLSNDLQKANQNRANIPWIISYQHRPFYCSNDNSVECRSFENWLVRTGYEEMPGLEKLFIENGMDIGFWGHEHSYERFYPVANRTLFIENGMDIGFWGHEHSYERFYPVANRTVYNDGMHPYKNAAAPTYIISGSAGCHTPKASFGPPNPASAFRSDDFGYTLMTVYNQTHIHLEQISVEKAGVIDDIWVIKDKGYRMTAKSRPSIKFPPAIYQENCSARDHRCRQEFEIRKRVSEKGFAM
uniref:Purple acid phosphatase n=1 Tax=Panagrolaimus sp. ES5 TaxID=591445 RepID=A0AC34FX18_9BILA